MARDGGSYVEGAVFVAKYFDRSGIESVQQFVNIYRARYNKDQDIAAALGHDAMRAVIAAIERGGVDRRGFARKMQTLTDLPGATGRISFRPGDRQNGWMYVLTIRRGEIRSLVGRADGSPSDTP